MESVVTDLELLGVTVNEIFAKSFRRVLVTGRVKSGHEVVVEIVVTA